MNITLKQMENLGFTIAIAQGLYARRANPTPEGFASIDDAFKTLLALSKALDTGEPVILNGVAANDN